MSEDRGARRRSLSQNFLSSRRVCAQLVEGAEVGAADLVLEIGAGSGALTDALSSRAGKVLAVEADPHWTGVLRGRFGKGSNVAIFEGDILSMPKPAKPYKVVSNIPFHLTTDILHYLLDDVGTAPDRADLVVAWQVAIKRSFVGSGNLLNLSWQPWFEFVVTRRLSRTLFAPAPSEDAAVLSIRRRQAPLISPGDRPAYVRTLRTCFSRNPIPAGSALAQVCGRQQVRNLARELGFSPSGSLVDLDVWQWAEVFRASRGGAQG